VIGLDAPFLLIAQALKGIDAIDGSDPQRVEPALGGAHRLRLDPRSAHRAEAGRHRPVALRTAVLVGWRPVPMSDLELASAGNVDPRHALLRSTLVFTKVHLKGASPMAIAAATFVLATLVLAPLVPSQAPDPATVPPLAWLALLGLALVSTTVAFIFYYRLIADIGPVKASTVTLLVPVFGMFWGVIFLGEPLTAGRIAGCAIILSGCALILGLVPATIGRPAA
jgi:uncharacterized membrane protein